MMTVPTFADDLRELRKETLMQAVEARLDAEALAVKAAWLGRALIAIGETLNANPARMADEDRQAEIARALGTSAAALPAAVNFDQVIAVATACRRAAERAGQLETDKKRLGIGDQPT